MNNQNPVILSIKNVNKKFGRCVALENVSLDIHEHDVVVLCGPSGGGKSTLLRTINGLEKTDSGEIFYRDTPVTPQNLRSVRQHIGMVFQQFNLFNNLNVQDNLIIAPMRIKKESRESALKRAKEYLESLNVGDKLLSYPHQLSGGQKQRVAIVRALMMNPDIMLFDEPTSALDPEMIKEVLDSMRRLSSMGMTMIVVTHEMGFAREVSNRVCFLEKAQIVVEASTSEFFGETHNERLKQFFSVILHH
jgi:ABC-type polar amino acid transport system ATPase subunit